jgi:hypothetical protein
MEFCSLFVGHVKVTKKSNYSILEYSARTHPIMRFAVESYPKAAFVVWCCLINTLLSPKNSNIAKQRRLACFAACSVWPMALHVVDIALRKLFVVAFMLLLLLSLICSKYSVDTADNFSPSGMPSIVDLHVITPVLYDICLL